MNVFPIFARELRCKSELRAWQRARVVTGLWAGSIFAVLMIVDGWLGGVSVTRFTMLAPFSGMLPFALLIIALNRAGTLLSAERREGTLPLLLLTHVSGFDILFGKLLQALVVEMTVFLGILPTLVLPLVALGFNLNEVFYISLGCLNVLFFGMAFGLFGSVFGEGRIAVSWCLFFLLPLVAYSTPLGFLIPGGRVRELLGTLQWLNPCDAVAKAQMAAAGFRTGDYWTSLAVNHAIAWLLLGLGGFLLPHVCRRQAGASGGAQAKKKWRPWKIRTANRSSLRRRPLLDVNPFLWLTLRDRWLISQVWTWVLVFPLGFGVLVWFTWAVRGLNVTVVLTVATALCWFVLLNAIVPSHAGRRIVSDRLSGVLGLVLCTPLGPREVARGIWLSLARIYVPPVLTVIFFSVALMSVGYATFGFGGMLEPEDRPLWIFGWVAGIVLLPLTLAAQSWVVLQRSLTVRDVGHGSGIAFLQVFGALALVLWAIYELGNHSHTWWMALLLSLASVTTLVAFAWHGRRVFLQNLRSAAFSH